MNVGLQHSAAAGRETKAHIGPNMIPMVDVVMCILIFFMLGSTFIVPQWLIKSATVTGPGFGDAKTTPTLPPVRTIIRISRRNGETYVQAFNAQPLKMGPFNGEANTAILNFIVTKAQSLTPNIQILIRPEGAVPYQDLITIYEDCLRAKFRQVAFAPAG